MTPRILAQQSNLLKIRYISAKSKSNPVTAKLTLDIWMLVEPNFEKNFINIHYYT